MSLSEKLKPLYHKGFTTRFEVDERELRPRIRIIVSFPNNKEWFDEWICYHHGESTEPEYILNAVRFRIDAMIDQARRIVETADASVIPDLFNF